MRTFLYGAMFMMARLTHKHLVVTAMSEYLEFALLTQAAGASVAHEPRRRVRQNTIHRKKERILLRRKKEHARSHPPIRNVWGITSRIPRGIPFTSGRFSTPIRSSGKSSV